MDCVLDLSNVINHQVTNLKKEAISITRVEKWIMNISNEMSQMKAQALFLNSVIENQYKVITKEKENN